MLALLQEAGGMREGFLSDRGKISRRNRRKQRTQHGRGKSLELIFRVLLEFNISYFSDLAGVVSVFFIRVFHAMVPCFDRISCSLYENSVGTQCCPR